MAKIHPSNPNDSASPLSCSSSSSSSSSSSPYITTKWESFTVWMKSLVMQGNGCTVFNEGGEIVYRVDNYDKKGSKEVYLMDLEGKVLFTICRRKRLCLFNQWKGYLGDGCISKKQKPVFQVQQYSGLFEESLSCKVKINGGRTSYYYRLECCLAGKSAAAFKVINNINGEVAAEAKRKELSTGLVLGDDVLNLVVQPHVDHSLVMALAIVYGLMHNRL